MGRKLCHKKVQLLKLWSSLVVHFWSSQTDKKVCTKHCCSSITNGNILETINSWPRFDMWHFNTRRVINFFCGFEKAFCISDVVLQKSLRYFYQHWKSLFACYSIIAFCIAILRCWASIITQWAKNKQFTLWKYISPYIFFFTVAQFGGIWERSEVENSSKSGIKRQK